MATIVTVREDMGEFFNPTTGEMKAKMYDYQIYNVSAPVGTRMANHFGDVVIVQALINVIYLDPSKRATIKMDWGHEDFHPEYKGYETPSVNGNFDMNTALAIKLFQIQRKTRPPLKADGIVQPLSFGGRNFKWAHGKPETISELNDAAHSYLVSRFGPKVRLTTTVPKLFPLVTAALVF